MIVSQLRLDESPFSHHQFIFMTFALIDKSFRNSKVHPIFRFFRKGIFDGNSNFTISEYFVEVLSSTFGITLNEA
jgi:hypothetical protein